MSETAEVLKVNGLFYQAFAERNLGLMEQVWANTVPVSCVHPGWSVLDDRTTILDSWRMILEGDDFPNVLADSAEVTFYGEVAVVVCFETVGDRRLIATNLFVLEDGDWRLAHHHAGPLAGAEEEEIDDDAMEGYDGPGSNAVH